MQPATEHTHSAPLLAIYSIDGSVFLFVQLNFNEKKRKNQKSAPLILMASFGNIS